MSDHATNETKTRILIKDMILEDLKRSGSIFAGLSEPEQQIASQLIIDYCIQQKVDNLWKSALKGVAQGVLKVLTVDGMLTETDSAVSSADRAGTGRTVFQHT